MDPLRIAIANDYEIVVEGLAQMLKPFEDRVKVVETVANERVSQDVDASRSSVGVAVVADTRSLPEGVGWWPGRAGEQLARRLEDLSWYSSRLERESEKGDQRNARLDLQLRGELARCEQALSSLYLRLEAEDSDWTRMFGPETVAQCSLPHASPPVSSA